MQALADWRRESGHFEARREGQARYWFESEVRQGLLARLETKPARAAMAQLGLPPRAIPARPDRAPHWPEGVLGSISHAGPFCLAVVGRSADWEMIGIDLEPDRAMAAELVSEVASPGELAALAPLPETLAATRIFSAKEAAYKAQYAVTQQYLGFAAMHIELSPTPEGNVGEFVATFRQTAGSHFRIGDRVVGRWRRVGPLLATAVALD